MPPRGHRAKKGSFNSRHCISCLTTIFSGSSAIISALRVLATPFRFVLDSSQFLHIRLVSKPRLLLAPHIVKRLVPC